MRGLGYHVPESQANFVWCTGGPPAPAIYEALKARKILVRLMRYPGQPDGLRITVGTDEEIDRLLAELPCLRAAAVSDAHFASRGMGRPGASRRDSMHRLRRDVVSGLGPGVVPSSVTVTVSWAAGLVGFVVTEALATGIRGIATTWMTVGLAAA